MKNLTESDSEWTALTRSNAVHSSVQAFEAATGMAIRLDPAGSGSRTHYHRNALFQERPVTDLQRQSLSRQPGENDRVTELEIPVLRGSRTVAWLHCRGVLSRQPPSPKLNAGVVALPANRLQTNRNNESQPPHPFNERIKGVKYMLEMLAKNIAEILTHREQTQALVHDPISKAKRFIQENLGENVGTSEAARAACLSLQHFCREFKAATGLTFTDYATRLRIEKAQQLLVDNRLRVSEIAFECGFRTIPHFDRVFKRYTGHNPTSYRQLGRLLPISNARKSTFTPEEEPVHHLPVSTAA